MSIDTRLNVSPIIYVCTSASRSSCKRAYQDLVVCSNNLLAVAKVKVIIMVLSNGSSYE